MTVVVETIDESLFIMSIKHYCPDRECCPDLVAKKVIGVSDKQWDKIWETEVVLYEIQKHRQHTVEGTAARRYYGMFRTYIQQDQMDNALTLLEYITQEEPWWQTRFINLPRVTGVKKVGNVSIKSNEKHLSSKPESKC